jgi:hypothetical protein
MYLDRKGQFNATCMALFAIGAVAYFGVVAPIGHALGLF